jgi:hypothetical protein
VSGHPPRRGSGLPEFQDSRMGKLIFGGFGSWEERGAEGMENGEG